MTHSEASKAPDTDPKIGSAFESLNDRRSWPSRKRIRIREAGRWRRDRLVRLMGRAPWSTRHSGEMIGDLAVRALEAAPALAPAPPAPVDVSRWTFANDIVVSGRGRLPSAVMDRYLEDRARGEI